MNSNLHTLDQLIQRVMSLLNSQHIRAIFDDPIDMATSTFDASSRSPRPTTNKEFLQTLGEFVAHIYRHAPELAPEPITEQAQREAVWLLEGAYCGRSGHGYEHALRTAAKYGYAAACSVIAEAIKAKCHAQYIHWVFVKHIVYLDAQTKKALTRSLLENWKGDPPEYLAERCVEELLPTCASIIQFQGDCLEDLDRMLGFTTTPVRTKVDGLLIETAERRPGVLPQ
jgi:hypothetical protein